MSTKTLRSALIAGGAALAAALAIAAPAAAQGPPGNNGTIKVDGEAFDTAPNNEPHVDCVFQVDFYGFDEGELNADVQFEAIPPTGGATAPGVELLTDTVFIGEDDNSGGGSEEGLDAERSYDLSEALASFTPHPQQGYHVRLTIHADGSQGADTKFKVFWVTGCETDETTTTTEAGETTTTEAGETTTTTEAGETTTTTEAGETTTTEAGETTTTVEGDEATTTVPGGPDDSMAPTTPDDVRGALPVTGSSNLGLAGLAAALVAFGVAGVFAARRLRSLDNS